MGMRAGWLRPSAGERELGVGAGEGGVRKPAAGRCARLHVKQDFADQRGFSDIGDPAQPAPAVGAGGDVDLEDTPQSLGPCHGREVPAVVVQRRRVWWRGRF